MWFIFALASALTWAIADAISKKILDKADVMSVVSIRFLYSLPFLWATIPFIKLPEIGMEFTFTILALVPFEVLAALLYIKAIKISPLSLTLPYLAFTPAFLLLVGYLMLGEKITGFGVIGILVVTIGAYVLNVDSKKKSIWAPLLAIRSEKGALLMLAVALIYSLTSSGSKKAILLSSPMFFAIVYFTLLATATVPLAAARSGWNNVLSHLRPTRWTIGMGVAFALMIIFHCLAVQWIEIAYMISVKRSSMIFGVILGWLFFKEKNFGIRLVGTSIMLTGIIIITLV